MLKSLQSNVIQNIVQVAPKMNDHCPELVQNCGNISFPSENIALNTEISDTVEREELINFSFDHMYACNSDDNELNNETSTGESEVKSLKELLLVHLDLIQHQSVELVNKETTIKRLKKENAMLKQRLNLMEHRLTFRNNHFNNSTHSNNNSDENMTHDTIYNNIDSDSEDTKTNIQLLNFDDPEINSNINNTMVNNTDFRESMSERQSSIKCYNNRSLRLKSPPIHSKLREELTKPVIQKSTKNQETCKEQTLVENLTNSDRRLHSASTSNRKCRKRKCTETLNHIETKKQRAHLIKRDTVLKTEGMYFTQMGEANNVFGPQDTKSELANENLEVPSWRNREFQSCYSMEGTENLDDDVFNKRHLRLENDERRRKRWDVQRIREQRHIEKLKQRQERIEAGLRSDEPLPDQTATLWPSLDDIEFIEITEKIPVSAFGFPVPEFMPSEFTLPWFDSNSAPIKKNTRTKKSTTRRKGTRR